MAVRTEIESFEKYIFSTIDRLVALLGELRPAEMNWRPPANEANSVYALTSHVLANAEENIMQTLLGQPYDRGHQEEFSTAGESAEPLSERWRLLKARLEAGLATLEAGDLDRDFSHPRRGMLPGREVLLVVARHAAEHFGQAELTRDLARQAGAGIL